MYNTWNLPHIMSKSNNSIIGCMIFSMTASVDRNDAQSQNFVTTGISAKKVSKLCPAILRR